MYVWIETEKKNYEQNQKKKNIWKRNFFVEMSRSQRKSIKI